MSWYYIFRVSDGKLVSETSTEPDSLDPSLDYVTTPGRADGRPWDTATRTFGVKPPRKTEEQKIMEVLDSDSEFASMTSNQRRQMRVTVRAMRRLL